MIKDGPLTLEQINSKWESKFKNLQAQYNMIHEDTIEGLRIRLDISGDVEIARISGNTRIGDWVIGDRTATLDSALVDRFPDLSMVGSFDNFNSKNITFGLLVQKYENGLGAVQLNGEIGNYYSDLAGLKIQNGKLIFLSTKSAGKAVNVKEIDLRKVYVQIGYIENEVLKIDTKFGHQDLGNELSI